MPSQIIPLEFSGAEAEWSSVFGPADDWYLCQVFADSAAFQVGFDAGLSRVVQRLGAQVPVLTIEPETTIYARSATGIPSKGSLVISRHPLTMLRDLLCASLERDGVENVAQLARDFRRRTGNG